MLSLSLLFVVLIFITLILNIYIFSVWLRRTDILVLEPFSVMGYLKEALWLPLSKIAEMIKIFWPYIVLGIIISFWKKISLSLGLEPLTLLTVNLFGEVFLLVYSCLLLFGGIVMWYRMLIFGEPARRPYWLLRGNYWSYFGYVILFGLLPLILMSAGIEIASASFLILATFYKIGDNSAESLDDLNNMSLWVEISFVVTLIIILVVCIWIFVLLYRNLFLVLPHIAIGEKGLLKGKRVRTKGWGWPAALLGVCLVPLFFSTMLGLITPTMNEDEWPVDWILVVDALGFLAWNIFMIYSAVSFATLLSLVYRDKIKDAL